MNKNDDGCIHYWLHGKKITYTYDRIQSPETTNGGVRGKWTPFGWKRKPGGGSSKSPPPSKPVVPPLVPVEDKKKKKFEKDDGYSGG